MRGHRRRRATKRCSATSICPKGSGGGGPSTAWALLGNERALPASRHLVSGPTALVTRPCPLLGPAPSPVLCVSAVGMATTETQSATN